MSAITTTGVLQASGASLSGPITNPAVVAGSASMPVYFTPAIQAVAGIYIAGTQDFVGTFMLFRHVSGWEASGNDVPQLAFEGTELEVSSKMTLSTTNLTSVVSLTSFDQATLTLSSWTSGQLAFAIVQ